MLHKHLISEIGTCLIFSSNITCLKSSALSQAAQGTKFAQIGKFTCKLSLICVNVLSRVGQLISW